jgi:hypothetical protein
MANTSPFSAGQIPNFQQLFDNTGTVLNNITNKTGSYYGTRVNGMDIHVTFDCTVDSRKTFPMGLLINAEQNLQYQANFMEPNFGIIQLEYAINDESFRSIAHQGANDMMSSQDHLLKPDRLSRFNLPSGHSIFNQAIRAPHPFLLPYQPAPHCPCLNIASALFCTPVTFNYLVFLLLLYK